MSIGPTSSMPQRDAPVRDADTVTTGSFADRIKFDKIFGGLEAKNIFLTEDEKKRLEKICLDELKASDGGQLNSTNWGARGADVMQLVMAFFQSLFSGNFSGLGNNLTGSGSTALDKTVLRDLEQASDNIYLKLRASGGNLAKTAELVAGVTTVGSHPGAVVDLDHSIFRQISAGLDIPWGTSTELNPGANYFPPSPTASLPTRSPTKPLTGRG